MKNLRAVSLALVSLAACAQRVRPPIADAGQTQQVHSGDVVRLSAANSTDPQGRPLAYDWSFLQRPAGSLAELIDSHSATPSFRADLQGEYAIQLIVSNSVLASEPAKVIVNVSTCGHWAPVVHSISASPATAYIGTVAQLSPAVDDDDNKPICGSLGQTFSYAWTMTKLPGGSQATLNGARAENPSIKADVAGDYVARLVVTDSTGLSSAPFDFTLHVIDCGGAAPTVVASADPSSTQPFPATSVKLNAAPADADAACGVPETFTYAWKISSRPAGSSAVLSDLAAPNPTFTPDVAGYFEFGVQVTDSSGKTSPVAYVTLLVTNCGELAPQVDAISILSGAAQGDVFKVQANSIADSNCLATLPRAFTSAWTLGAVPTGSRAILDDPTSATPSFLADLPGTYQLSLVVTNSRGKTSAPVYKTLNVQPCGTSPLRWDKPNDVTVTVVDPQPTSDTQIHVGGLVTVSPHATDPNTCGAVPVKIAYRTSIISAPAGSRATLSAPTDPNPSFVPDLNGSYQLAISATDSLGNVSPFDYVTVTTSTCGANPVGVEIAPAGSTPSEPLATSSFSPLALALTGGTATSGDNQQDPSAAAYCPARFKTSFNYAWAVVNQPAGGSSSLAALTGTSTVFQSSFSGPYAVQVTATGSNGLVARSTAYVKVTACGGSAPVINSTTTTVLVKGVPTPSTRPPVGTEVTLTANGVSPDSLNGCGSAPTLTTIWSLVQSPAGSSVSVATQDGTPSFKFTPDAAGTYFFSVVVKDAHGLVSSPVTVTVSTGACGPTVPGILATQVGTAQVGNQISLNAAAGITDTCVPAATYTYAWQIISRPAASSSSLDAVTGNLVHFVPDSAGDYTVALTVTDSGGFSTTVTTVIHQGPCTAAPVLATPTFVGPTNVVYRGDPVTVSVPSITAGNCGTLTSTSYSYTWALVSKPVGSGTTLSSSSAASPGFVADVAGGSYQLAVQVKDALGNSSAPAFVTVPVSACGSQRPAVALDKNSVTQLNFAPVTITATGTSPDNQNDSTQPGFCPARFAKTLSYQWQVTSSPVGAQFSLGGATTNVATFAPGAKGGYQLQLLVTDSSNLASAPATVPVTVACGDATPVAKDGAAPAFQAKQHLASILQKTSAGTSVGALDITSSTVAAGAVRFYPANSIKLSANVVDDNLTCGFTPTTINYKWSFTSVPIGSQVAFDNSTAATPSFVPDLPGDYFIQLDLKDAAGKSGSQVFTLPSSAAVVSVSSCGSQTPSSLIGLQSPASPAPTANIGAVNGFAVILDGSSSYHPDNLPLDFTQATVPGCGLNKALAYRWNFVSTPPNAGGVTFNDPTRVNPSFTPTVSGSYVVSLAVNDGQRTSTTSTVQVVTANGASGNLDFNPTSDTVLPGGVHHYNTFRIPAGVQVTLDPNAQNGGVLDLLVSGDVYIGGTLNLSGSPGANGPNGDVSWQGSGGGETAYPFLSHGTPNPGQGCSGNGTQGVAITVAGGGSGYAGGTSVTASSTGSCGGGLGGNAGGGGGGGVAGGGGGGYGGGGGGGINSCAGFTSAGGSGGGSYGGAGGGVAQAGRGGTGGGAPYDGVTPRDLINGDCTNSGYGGGGGGGSIGLDAVNDLSMASSLRAGSAGGGGAGDEGRGGGGGAGAVRIRSNTSITVAGQILAQGGHGGDSGGDPNCCQGGSGGGGSGGAIWLGAPIVYNAGTVSTAGGRGGLGQSSRGGGGAAPGGAGGLGRIRIQSPSITNYGILAPPLPPTLDGSTNGRGKTYVVPTYP